MKQKFKCDLFNITISLLVKNKNLLFWDHGAIIYFDWDSNLRICHQPGLEAQKVETL